MMINSLGNRQLLAGSSHRVRNTLMPALLACTVGLGACGSSNSTAVVDHDASSMMDAAVVLGTIVRGAPQPCTEAHTICVNAKFPATMTTQPVKLQIDLYATIPPTHPPDGLPLVINMPQLTAGETVQLRMSDLGLTGNFFFLGIVYMAGGGYGIPVRMVDYTGDSAISHALTGAAFNLSETLDFQYAP